MTTEIEKPDENQTTQPQNQLHQNLQKKERLNSPSLPTIQTNNTTTTSGWNKNDNLSVERTHGGLNNVVLGDPNIKFPLENSWSFWFYKNDKTKKWEENINFITTVDFVEDFWG
jgi:hypothetical protein